MDFSKCHFYNMKSKNRLLKCLYISELELGEISNKYKVYISNKNGKERLVEEPFGKLKQVQKRIKQLFDKSLTENLPFYIKCKKNSSWIDVANYHKFSNTIVCFDISKFFPSISYDMIVKFFTKHLKTSSIVADLLAQIITIDYENIIVKSEVNDWYDKVNKGRKHTMPYRHLPTGSSVSVMISELAGYDMFEEINNYCKMHGFLFTAYVDDLHVSSKNRISKLHCKKILGIINKYGFESNDDKLKVYLPKSDAIITGVVKLKSTYHTTIKYSLEGKLTNLLNDYNINNKKKIIGILNLVKIIDFRKFNYYTNILENKEKFMRN